MEQDNPSAEDIEFANIVKTLGSIRQYRLTKKHRALHHAEQALKQEQNKLDTLNSQFEQQKEDYQEFKSELLAQGVVKVAPRELQLDRSKEQQQMQKLEDCYQEVTNQEPVIEECENKLIDAQQELKQQQKSCERLTMLETLRQE